MEVYIKNTSDLALVENKYQELLNHCKVQLKEEELGKIREACSYLGGKHRDERKKSGELCIVHSFEVAIITADELGLGYISVISALFHNLILDHEVELDEITTHFGPQIASIVEGLTKIGSIASKQVYNQAENFRKLMLSLASDVRVVLIKTADRLHNMRILHTLPENARLRIANETLLLYAPTAHRLGLYNIKTELEDLSLKYLNPEKFNEISQKIKESEELRNAFITGFTKPIEKDLQKHKLKFEIKSRTKSIFSIHNKMSKQGIPFEEIYDLFAIRIILDVDSEDEKYECWQAYSIVSNHYQPNPERMRDWISVPKSNGYESLHTTVIVPGGKWVEVQIRTRRMDEIAEKGYAAHWKYKGIESDAGLEKWLVKVREILETAASDDEKLMDEFRLNLYNDEVFVFTPNGDLKRFPKGSSVLDFAYDIHSDIGDNCIGAKLNNKNVSIKQKLINGAKIEILTSKNQKPRQVWLNFVKTSKARSKIKHFLREEEYKEVEQGKEIIQRRLKNWKFGFNEKIINDIIRQFKYKNATDFYYEVANEKMDLAEIKEFLENRDNQQVTVESQEKTDDQASVQEFVKASEDFLIIDDKLDNIEYNLAKCCNPIKGDPVFGFVTINRGIKVHRTDCPNAAEMMSKYPYRLVNAKWKDSIKDVLFKAAIKVSGADDFDIVSRITDIISKDLKVNLRAIDTSAENGVFQAVIKINIKNKEHLQVLIHKLLKVKGISNVSRYDFIDE